MTNNMESAYEASKYESDIYNKWNKSGKFTPKIDKNKKPFSITLPPPNATGKLHLGHATMLAIEDIMVRFHRMKGDSTLWLPGTDHAAIATQSVVEKQLQEKGIKNPRKELGREKLIEEIKEFVEDSKSNIRNQMRKMGASCDWSREKYTLDPHMNHAVNTLFKYMYEDGLIYRGGRIVNWDPNMKTTVADDEMEYIEEKSEFYYFQYGPVVIGTARPETKFKDKVIVVHPKDKRYKDLIGKEFEVEWIEGKIKAKVIADECIDMEMGTGAMTITPAHSLVDFEIAEKNKLKVEQIIDFDGNIRMDASEEFGGMNIKDARKKIVEKLEKRGLLVKIDKNYVHNVAVNYRGKGKIEPQVMKQWFIDVNKKVIDWKGQKLSIKEVLMDTVKSGMIEIVPERFEKTYFHWIENLRDWCISRQIWWGHQIPVWYEVDSEKYQEYNQKPDISGYDLEIMGINGKHVFSEEKPKNGKWVRDPDTLDTWFSSALWTFATMGWPEKTEDLEYFHPTNVLETGYDIIFFWVARMILASTYALRKDGYPEEKSIPFKVVYLHGLIRDKNGKKMSKSSPETCIDPLDMIDKYGADALRLSLTIGSSAGNDMRLYEEKIAGYRNFINKIWNATRFALMNVSAEDIQKNIGLHSPDPANMSEHDKWILSELQRLINKVESELLGHRYSDAGNRIYEFLWSKLCDWYLEMSKVQEKNPEVLLFVLKNTLKLLHPFVPFVTEKLWEYMNEKELLISSEWPVHNKSLVFNKEDINVNFLQKLITEIRSARAELKVEPAKKITAYIYTEKNKPLIEKNNLILLNLARLEHIEFTEQELNPKENKVIIIEETTIYLPLKDLVDPEKEINRLKKELEKLKQLITNLENKLNSNFVEKAPPEVVVKEKNRLSDSKKQLSKIQKQLAEFGVIN